MPGITQSVNQLLNQHSISEEDLRAFLDRYQDEVSVVNERLGEAADLVKRGLRSEAMAIIGSSPSLIDRANELVIPRFDELGDLLELYDLPAVTVVDTESVELISDAMVELQSIDSLLRRQRQLVLAHAPLSWRLRTLRAIAAADPTNTHWLDDIDAYEKVRHDQLAGDVEVAIESEDENALVALDNELSGNWQTDPPDRLRNSVGLKLKSLWLAKKQAELGEFAEQIRDAMDQYNESATRQAAARYQSLHDEIGRDFGVSAIPADAVSVAQPGLEYLADLDAENKRLQARASALAKLENTMDNRATTVALIESAYQKAVAFDEPLPVELFNRYRSTIDDLQTRGKRRFQFLVGFVLTASLVVAGLLVTWQMRRAYSDKIAKVSTQLRGLLDNSQLDEAGKFIDAVNKTQPALAAAPEIGELIARHRSLTQAEEDRAERFKKQLDELEQLADDALDSASLSRVEDAAVTEDEKLSVLVHRRRYEKFVTDRRNVQNQALAEALKEIRDQVGEFSKSSLEAGSLEDIRSKLVAMDEFNERIKETVAGFPRAGASAKKEVENQSRRLTALKRRLKEQERLLEESSRATRDLLSARSLTALKSRLVEFVSELPTNPQSASYREALDAVEFWGSCETWNKHLTQIAESFHKRFAPGTASLAQDSAESFFQSCSSAPFTIPSSVQRSIELADSRQGILTEMENILDRSLFSQIISVTQANGKGDRIFIYKKAYDEDREKLTSSLEQISRVEVIQTGDGAIQDQTLKGPLLIELEPANTVLKLKADLAEARSKALADWNGVLLRWLAGLSRREDLDSNIKEILLSQMLERIIKGSNENDAGPLTKVNLGLATRRGKWEDWFRPTVRDVQASNLLTQKVLPALAIVYRNHRKPIADLPTLATLRTEPVGIWNVHASKGTPSSAATPIIHFWKSAEQLPLGILLVVRRDPSNPLKGKWIPFGKLRQGEIQLDAGELTMIAGEPVFLSQGIPTGAVPRGSQPEPGIVSNRP